MTELLIALISGGLGAVIALRVQRVVIHRRVRKALAPLMESYDEVMAKEGQ